MAAGGQELRTRIRSVRNTRKITKAMEMIANAKLVRQRTRMEANREYTRILQETVSEIMTADPEAESLYMKKKGTSTKTGAVVFCSDLGLCGGYNQNILNLLEKELTEDDPVVLIGTSLYSQLQENGYHLINDHPVQTDKLDFAQLKGYVDTLMNLYLKDETGKLLVFYTKFVNTMVFEASAEQLLPAELKITSEKKEMHQETLFEPNSEVILDQLIPMMVRNGAYSGWMESGVSEQGSRRVAMKTASDNADDLISSLQLQYNKARQAAITQEITEIVSGSNAV